MQPDKQIDMDKMRLAMQDAEEAWRLVHAMRTASNALWDLYEEEFIEFIQEEHKQNMYVMRRVDTAIEDQLPF